MFNAYFKQRTHIHYISRTPMEKTVNPPTPPKNGQKASTGTLQTSESQSARNVGNNVQVH